MGRTLDEMMVSLPTERRQTIEARADELLREMEGGRALSVPTACRQEQIDDGDLQSLTTISPSDA